MARRPEPVLPLSRSRTPSRLTDEWARGKGTHKIGENRTALSPLTYRRRLAMGLSFKDAVKNMHKDRSKKYFYFFCEKAKDGKPAVLADTKKFDPKKDEAKELLDEAKVKGISAGIMQIDEEGTLNLKPQGTGVA